MRAGMLTRLEGLYLNILRAVIIILATVMLAAAVVGAVIAGPMLLSSFASDRGAERLVEDDDLQTFLGGQSALQPGGKQAGPSAETEARAAAADERLREASGHIVAYFEARFGQTIPAPALTEYLNEKMLELSPELHDPYMDSLLTLGRDLAARAPADPRVDVDQLIEWHHGRFVRAMQEAEAQNAERAAEAVERRTAAFATAGLAIVAFGLFLLMVFVFVLVKIERNLRLVAVRVSPAADDQATAVQP